MTGTIVDEHLLETKLTELEKARTWTPRVISKLESTIRTADDFALFRLNPIRYAVEKNMSEGEAIDLFLHATKLGLFEMEWHLVCRSCGHNIDNFGDLVHVHSHAICDVCRAEQEASLDDYIQVSFTISGQIRDIVYRHPERLSIEEFYLKYHLNKELSPLPNGMPFSGALNAGTRIMTYLDPGEKASAEFALIPGMLAATDLLNKTTISFFTEDGQDSEHQQISLKMEEGKFRAPEKALRSVKATVGSTEMNLEQFDEIGTGKMSIEVENLMDKRSAIWMINLPFEATEEANLPRFEPFLSGKQLLTTQTFRDLFRSEVVQSSEGLGIKDITFLFTDLKGSTALYDAIGDPKAYYLVRQHFDTLGRAITRHSGAIVKTIGDAVMATFMNPLDATAAAMDMLEELDAFNRTIVEDIILKIGIHKGHCIAVTLNDRLDYFGQTVNISARIQALADADEIYLSQSAYSSPGVAELLAARQVIPTEAAVKGVSEKLRVYKVLRS